MTYVKKPYPGMSSADYYTAETRNKKFDVRDAGCYVDDSHDDTVNFQATILEAIAEGGGDVIIPNNGHAMIIDGPLQRNVGGIDYKSQIYTPYVPFADTSRCYIRIRGENPPNFIQSGAVVAYFSPNIGSRIRSTLVSNVADSYVIASRGTNDTNPLYFNSHDLAVQDLTIQLALNGSYQVTLGGVDVRRTGNAYFKDIAIYPFNRALISSAAPINGCIGIAMGIYNCGNSQLIDHCAVGGLETGFLLGDHASLKDTYTTCCKYSYQFGSAIQIIHATRIGSYWSMYDFYFSGKANVKINSFQGEWISDGSWYSNLHTVLDANNYGLGEIHYNMSEVNVGFNNAKFTKSGGTGLQCIPICFVSNSSFTLTGSTDAEKLASVIAVLKAKGIAI